MRDMESIAPLTFAIRRVGLSALSRLLGVSYQAVRKWESAGCMPRTEWTGETKYAEIIETATSGAVTREMLLARPWLPITTEIEKAA